MDPVSKPFPLGSEIKSLFGSLLVPQANVEEKKDDQPPVKIAKDNQESCDAVSIQNDETLKRKDITRNVVSAAGKCFSKKDFTERSSAAVSSLLDQSYPEAYSQFSAILSQYTKDVCKEIKISPQKAGICRYACAVSGVLSNNFDHVCRGVALLNELLKEFTFKEFFFIEYGIVRAQMVLSRYELAKKKAAEMISNLSELSSTNATETYPGTDIVIPESDAKQLVKMLEEVISQCSGFRRPDAVCSYTKCQDCGNHPFPDRRMFKGDLNFRGYMELICSQKCKIQYHQHCWKLLKLEDWEDKSEKDILGLPCVTPDCAGQISRLVSYDSNWQKKHQASVDEHKESRKRIEDVEGEKSKRKKTCERLKKESKWKPTTSISENKENEAAALEETADHQEQDQEAHEIVAPKKKKKKKNNTLAPMPPLGVWATKKAVFGVNEEFPVVEPERAAKGFIPPGAPGWDNKKVKKKKQAQGTNADDYNLDIFVDDTEIRRFLKDWLTAYFLEHGPLTIHDLGLQQMVSEHFPPEAHELIRACGGLLKFLLSMDEFNQMEDLIYLTEHEQYAIERINERILEAGEDESFPPLEKLASRDVREGRGLGDIDDDFDVDFIKIPKMKGGGKSKKSTSLNMIDDFEGCDSLPVAVISGNDQVIKTIKLLGDFDDDFDDVPARVKTKVNEPILSPAPSTDVPTDVQPNTDLNSDINVIPSQQFTDRDTDSKPLSVSVDTVELSAESAVISPASALPGAAISPATVLPVAANTELALPNHSYVVKSALSPKKKKTMNSLDLFDDDEEIMNIENRQKDMTDISSLLDSLTMKQPITDLNWGSSDSVAPTGVATLPATSGADFKMKENTVERQATGKVFDEDLSAIRGSDSSLGTNGSSMIPSDRKRTLDYASASPSFTSVPSFTTPAGLFGSDPAKSVSSSQASNFGNMDPRSSLYPSGAVSPFFNVPVPASHQKFAQLAPPPPPFQIMHNRPVGPPWPNPPVPVRSQSDIDLIAALQKHVRDLIFSRDSDSNRYKVECENYQKTIQDLKTSLERQNKLVEVHKAEADTAHNNLAEAIEERDAANLEAQSLKQRFGALSEQYETLKVQKSKLEDTVRSLGDQIESLLEERETYNTKQEETQRLSDEALARVIKDATEEKKNLSVLLDTARGDRATLYSAFTNKVAEEKSMKEALEGYAAQIKDLKNRLAVSEASLIRQQLKHCQYQYDVREQTLNTYIQRFEASSDPREQDQLKKLRDQLEADRRERAIMEANAQVELATVAVGIPRQMSANNNVPSLLSGNALTNGTASFLAASQSVAAGSVFPTGPADPRVPNPPAAQPPARIPTPIVTSAQTTSSPGVSDSRSKLDQLISMVQKEVPSMTPSTIHSHILEYYRTNGTELRGVSSADIVAFVKKKLPLPQAAAPPRLKPVKKSGLIDDDFDLPLTIATPAAPAPVAPAASSSVPSSATAIRKAPENDARLKAARPKLPVIGGDKPTPVAAPPKPTGPPKGWKVPREKKEWDGQDENTCSICICEMKYFNREELPCKHAYHAHCIRQWLEKERNCPICRTYVVVSNDFPALNRN